MPLETVLYGMKFMLHSNGPGQMVNLSFYPLQGASNGGLLGLSSVAKIWPQEQDAWPGKP